MPIRDAIAAAAAALLVVCKLDERVTDESELLQRALDAVNVEWDLAHDLREECPR